MRQSARRENGMAVISALLVVAAAAVIASSMLASQTTQVRTLESERARVQARWLLSGGVDWARNILRSDARRNATTRGDQIWATPISDLRISPEGDEQEAIFSGRIDDEQGKFNLQNLARQGQVQPEDVAKFKRLLQSLSIPVQSVPALALRVAMGQARAPAKSGNASSDSGAPNSGDGSASSGSEASPPDTNKPNGAGNTAPAGTALAPGLRSVDDLRAFNFDEDALLRLRAYVTVLPARTAVNMNTASAEVLSAVIESLSLAQAREVSDQRDRGQYFNNQADFKNRLADPTIDIPDGALTANSQWFSVNGTVRVEQANVDMRALLHREAQATPTIVWMMEAN